MDWKLQRLFAYTVVPSRLTQAAGEPVGGSVKVGRAEREIVAKTLSKVPVSRLTSVDFVMSPDRRHRVRDAITSIAFSGGPGPSNAARQLATYLSMAMDARYDAGLLMVVVEDATKDPSHKRVSLGMLPREDVVRLRNAKAATEAMLSQLTDVFSIDSSVRKFSQMDGHNVKTDFLNARLLDFQIDHSNRVIADFWMRDFLQARPQMDTKTGGAILAAALNRAFSAAPEEEREEVFATIMQYRTGRQRTVQLRQVGESLPELSRAAFLAGLPNTETLASSFTLDPAIVRDRIGIRVITCEDGVILHAPADSVGKSLHIHQQTEHRTVAYRGAVASERVARGRIRETGRAPSESRGRRG